MRNRSDFCSKVNLDKLILYEWIVRNGSPIVDLN